MAIWGLRRSPSAIRLRRSAAATLRVRRSPHTSHLRCFGTALQAALRIASPALRAYLVIRIGISYLSYQVLDTEAAILDTRAGEACDTRAGEVCDISES